MIGPASPRTNSRTDRARRLSLSGDVACSHSVYQAAGLGSPIGRNRARPTARQPSATSRRSRRRAVRPAAGGELTASSPADAMQPQFEQSGVPPNWHGRDLALEVGRDAASWSARRCTRRGSAGGFAYTLISPSGIAQLRDTACAAHQRGDDPLAIRGPQPLLRRPRRPAACRG